MFGKEDKITLTLINARDINGNILPFQLKIPSDNKYNLPEGIASLDVFEYHEGLVSGGKVAFSIYIGRVTTVENIILEKTSKTVKIHKNLEITSLKSPVCFQNILDDKIIFATLSDQDIVVENHQQMMMIIEKISNEYNSIYKSIKNIKTLSKKKN